MLKLGTKKLANQGSKIKPDETKVTTANPRKSKPM
jgi:hypothetical protein